MRSLLYLLLPCATLMATMQPVAKEPIPGAQDQISLQPVTPPAGPAAPPAEELSALEQLQAKAEAGDLESQAALGIMYYWGQGVETDWKKAQVWLRKASERGNPDAQAKLGAMCFLGQGGPRDLDESLKWFRAAAEQGEPYAEGCMGVMYAVGEGVPKDLVLADFWLTLARDGGDTDAAEPLAQVEAHLTKDQLKAAKERLANRAVNPQTAN